MRLKAKLSSGSLKQMADDLLSYKDGFINNLRIFRQELGYKGIRVAMSSASQGFGGQYIMFEMTDSENQTVLVARETSQILSEWLYYGEVVQAWVSPLLMAEFGSGKYAVTWVDSTGNSTPTLSDGTPVGRGSFPDQRNAFKDSWWYMDLSQNWHQASGITPTRPMHNAVIEIITQVERTAKEVFGHG